MSIFGLPGNRSLWQYTPCWPTSAIESVSRSSATAIRPRAVPIIVSCTSSASRCLSNGVGMVALLSRWPAGTNLDAARHAARIAVQQSHHDGGDVFGRGLPVGAVRLAAVVEAGGDRSRQHVADADAVVADFLHQGFAELVE